MGYQNNDNAIVRPKGASKYLPWKKQKDEVTTPDNKKMADIKKILLKHNSKGIEGKHNLLYNLGLSKKIRVPITIPDDINVPGARTVLVAGHQVPFTLTMYYLAREKKMKRMTRIDEDHQFVVEEIKPITSGHANLVCF